MADERRARRRCAAGIFLALLGIYLLSAPGRIDIIDGQWRYEVAKNWLDRGEPLVVDRWLFATQGQVQNPVTGKSYASYNAAPSLTPLPLMLLSRLLPGHNVERDQFAFSLAGPIAGALLGALLILAYGWLGVALRPSLLYTLLFCLATLWWPASVTVFDQNQHALVLMATVLLAWQAGRRRSTALAGIAGLLGGILINYQEIYALCLPVAALAALAAPEEGSPIAAALLGRTLDQTALRRCLMFAVGCCVGLGLFFAYNEIRVGSPFVLVRYGGHDAIPLPRWGNPLAGFLGLTISPGKGVLWFSPPLALVLLGAKGLFRRAPALALTTAGISCCYILVIIHLSFFGGDWCWGPRYLIPVMPLWALAFPFAVVRLPQPRRLLVPLAAAGLLVQVVGISIDTHRFFYERNLPAFFWAFDPWFYFRDSQLAARPFEIWESIRSGPPPEANRFNCSPTGQVTYCPFGIPNPALSRAWMRQFQIFYLPRPWWGWMSRVVPEKRPVDPTGFMVICGVLLAAGGALLYKSWDAATTGVGWAREGSRLEWTGSAVAVPAAKGEALHPQGGSQP